VDVAALERDLLFLARLLHHHRLRFLRHVLAIGDRQHHQRVAFAHRVADGDLDLLDRPALGRGDLHGGLLGLQDDQRILRGHLVADRYEDLGNRHIGEVPDVGDQDVERAAHSRTLRRSLRTPDRCATKRAAAAPSMTRWS
jgi:hypothetical protein